MLDLGDSIRSFFIYLIRSAWPEKNLGLECTGSTCNRRAEDGKNAIWESGLKAQDGKNAIRESGLKMERMQFGNQDSRLKMERMQFGNQDSRLNSVNLTKRISEKICEGVINLQLQGDHNLNETPSLRPGFKE